MLFTATIRIVSGTCPQVYFDTDDASAEDFAEHIGGEIVELAPATRPPVNRCLCCSADLHESWNREAGMCVPCQRRGRGYEAAWEFKRRLERHQEAWRQHVAQMADGVAA